jgi:diaminopimelate decarboxylase
VTIEDEAWSAPHLPITAVVEPGAMSVGGCSVAELVAEYGSPLQIVDAADLDVRADAYATALDALARPARAVFATKALPVIAVVARLGRDRIGADVTTAGELALALAADIDPARIVHHGNARSIEEMREAVDHQVGLVVIDGPQDIEHLDAVATRPVDVLLRITPGIAPATHESMATAHHGQKFGVTLDEAPPLFRAIAKTKWLRLRGLHFHVGSQITALEPFADAVARVGGLGSFEILDAGGGLGVPFTEVMEAPTIEAHIQALDAAMSAAGFDPGTELIVEPGRSLVARAVVTVYRVRTVKTTAGHTFVAVDGGTSDDIEAVTGLRIPAPFALVDGVRSEITLVGLHCDSGDVLARDVAFGAVEPGSLVVMPGTGAYTFSLANNYNCAPRPAVVEVESGSSRTLVRRETIADLLARQTEVSGAALPA